VTVTVPEQSPGSSGGDYCTSILEDFAAYRSGDSGWLCEASLIFNTHLVLEFFLAVAVNGQVVVSLAGLAAQTAGSSPAQMYVH
jgi:hypothetical protein